MYDDIEKKNRQIKIKNQMEDDTRQLAIFHQRQAELYQNSLLLNQHPTLAEILLKENQPLIKEENLGDDLKTMNLIN
jgi:hypothetical protein